MNKGTTQVELEDGSGLGKKLGYLIQFVFPRLFSSPSSPSLVAADGRAMMRMAEASS